MKNLLKCLLLLVAMVAASSCQKPVEVGSLNPRVGSKLSENEKETLLNSFSQALAKAMQAEPEFRAFLKQEATKQFDGDYDILYVNIKNMPFKSGVTVHDLIARFVLTQQSLDDVENRFLELNIKFPVLPEIQVEDWDTDKFVPKVVVRGYVNHPDSLVAYNSVGNKLYLKSKEAPTEVTAVVEESERIEITSLATFQHDVNQSLAKFTANQSLKSQGDQSLYSTEGVTSGGSRGSGNPAWGYDCPRNQAVGRRNILSSIYIPRAAWEYASDNWTEGRLEIAATLLTLRGDSKSFDQLTLIASIYESETTYNPSLGRAPFRTKYGYDRWVTFGPGNGAYLQEWDVTLQGDRWKIIFSEQDPGDRTYEVSDSFSSSFDFGIKTTDSNKNVIGFNAGYKGAETGSTKLTFKDVDDRLGESYINRCDKLGEFQSYSTGSIQFEIVTE